MSIYTYYDSKLDILRALWGNVFNDLFVRIAHVNTLGTSEVECLSRTCQTYVSYWLEQPDAYRLVFMSSGVTQSEVGGFMKSTAMPSEYKIFAAGLAAASNRTETEVAVHAQVLVCGLIGIVHSLITISHHTWSPADKLASALVEGIVLSARGS